MSPLNVLHDVSPEVKRLVSMVLSAFLGLSFLGQLLNDVNNRYYYNEYYFRNNYYFDHIFRTVVYALSFVACVFGFFGACKRHPRFMTYFVWLLLVLLVLCLFNLIEDILNDHNLSDILWDVLDACVLLIAILFAQDLSSNNYLPL